MCSIDPANDKQDEGQSCAVSCKIINFAYSLSNDIFTYRDLNIGITFIK